MKYVLASSSPRRIEFFKYISEDFTVAPSNADETLTNFFSESEIERLLIQSPETLSMRVAEEKAKDESLKFPLDLVVGADTGVFIQGKMIGKPKDEKDAERLLRLLSGKTHSVITGYAIIYKGKTTLGYDKTDVLFENLSDDTIYSYLKSGLYVGKAGAYGIQDGFPLVKSIDGDYKNVMGFPLDKIKKDIEKVLKNG